MRKIVSLALATAVCGALAACASAPPAAVPAGAERLPASEIHALLALPVRFDNDIVGGLTYAFAPDGTVVFSMRMLPARKAGRWQVDGDQLCIAVDGGRWECGPLYRIGTTRFYFDLPGYDGAYNTLIRRS